MSRFDLDLQTDETQPPPGLVHRLRERLSYRTRRVERLLRSHATPAPKGLVHAIEATLDRPTRRTSPRRALTVAFAGAVVLTFSAQVGAVSVVAGSARDVARIVDRTLRPTDRVLLSANAGSDQYRPGYGWGDPNHTHTGPPRGRYVGGARVARQLWTVTITTRLSLDEQALLRTSVLAADGSRIPIIQSASSIGRGVDGPATKRILYRVLVPRTLLLRLTLPGRLAPPGSTVRVVVLAVDPDGERTTFTIRVRIPS